MWFLWQAPAAVPNYTYPHTHMGKGELRFMLALFKVRHKKSFHRLCKADVS